MKALAGEIVEYVLKCVFCPESACNLLTPGDPESKSSDGTLSIFCRLLGDRLGNGFLDSLMMRKTVTKFTLRHLYSRYKAYGLCLFTYPHHILQTKNPVNSLFHFVSEKPSSVFQTKTSKPTAQNVQLQCSTPILVKHIYKAQIIQIK